MLAALFVKDFCYEIQKCEIKMTNLAEFQNEGCG
jgi:hypothetical protein